MFDQHRQHIDQLIAAALAAANPAAAVKQHLQRNGRRLSIDNYSFDLDAGRVFVVSTGKAATSMGLTAAEVLADDLTAAILIDKRSKSDVEAGEKLNDQRPIHLFQAGHPVSDETSVRATAAVVEMLAHTEASDLVLCLISGGSSALFTQPHIALSDWQLLLQSLLASGCTINELNSVRKQLDRVKGGGLARLAAPAACVGLILSDVVGNPLDIIGSGPTVANRESPNVARDILERYKVADELPAATWHNIRRHLAEKEQEPLAMDSPVINVIVGDVRQAASAAVAAATSLGFSSELLTAYLEGEAREVGRVVAALAKEAAPNRCLVLGGETTVTLRGTGLGGRNQELALAAAIALAGWDNVVVASFASDGDDGPTGAAGAIATCATVSQAHQLGLDPLDFLGRNDSYSFFKQLQGLIHTGPTGTNVNDLVFILTYEE